MVLKTPKPELAQSRTEVDRFVQEVQAVNRISDQHFVEISDCINKALPGGECACDRLRSFEGAGPQRRDLCRAPVTCDRRMPDDQRVGSDLRPASSSSNAKGGRGRWTRLLSPKISGDSVRRAT